MSTCATRSGGTCWPLMSGPAIRDARGKVEGLPAGVRHHGLRHYSASFLIAKGGDVKVVQLRLRHASRAERACHDVLAGQKRCPRLAVEVHIELARPSSSSLLSGTDRATTCYNARNCSAKLVAYTIPRELT